MNLKVLETMKTPPEFARSFADNREAMIVYEKGGVAESMSHYSVDEIYELI